MAAEYVGNGNPDGTVFGRTSSELIAFYGGTPLARVSLAQQSGTKTTTQLRAELSALQNALHNLGLINVT